jgi:ABC-type amino acid transport system permease subunit
MQMWNGAFIGRGLPALVQIFQFNMGLPKNGGDRDMGPMGAIIIFGAILMGKMIIATIGWNGVSY